MKTIFKLASVAFSLLGIAFSAMADDLKTLSGKVYSNFAVLRVEGDAVAISHEDGLAKVPFADVPEDLRAKLGYDPAKFATSAKVVPPPAAAALVNPTIGGDPVTTFKEMVSKLPRRSVRESGEPYAVSDVTFDVKKTESLINPMIGVIYLTTNETVAKTPVQMDFEMVFHWQANRWTYERVFNKKNGADFTGKGLFNGGEMKLFLGQLK